MPILEITDQIDLDHPVLVLAISGWVDGGQVATRIGEHLAERGRVVARFRADEIYDYRENRPTLEFVDGAATEIRFPSLNVSALSLDRADLLVVAGSEPNFRWETVSSELAALAGSLGVSRVVSVGAVPALVAHTRPTPVMITSTDPGLDPFGLPAEKLVVPAAMVNVLASHVARANDLPEVGFWAQVPHYVSGAYWPGVETLLTRLSTYLGVDLDLAVISARSRDMVARLDEAVAASPDAAAFVSDMENSDPGFAIDDTSGLSEEIEDFLRSLGDQD